jgi:ribosomal protein S14
MALGEINLEKKRCQSCGMPLGEFNGFDNFGTNLNGTRNLEYCRMCFQRGEFTKPSMKLADMLAASVNYMVKEMGIPRDRARQLTHEVIPNLKRWKRKRFV